MVNHPIMSARIVTMFVKIIVPPSTRDDPDEAFTGMLKATRAQSR